MTKKAKGRSKWQQPEIISYGRQWIDDADIEAVERTLRSDYLTQGPMVAQFEQKIAAYCGVKYAVAFSSGTAALHGACLAAGIDKGDEVITTPMTFVASANCVLYSGAKPVFADIKAEMPLIDPEEIRRKITRKTKAIIAVDYAGIPADYDEINKVAEPNKLLVIADASHSLGATYKGKKVGSLAGMSVFSFHAIKAITTGEGGMVVTNNSHFFQKLKIFRTHGISKDKEYFRSENAGAWYYEMQELGYNYRLTEIQAALGFSQMRKLDSFIRRRQEIAQVYQHVFKDLSSVSTLSIPKQRQSAWHLYPLLLNKRLVQKKKTIFEEFRSRGIGVQVHYIPVHLHPYYVKQFGFKRGDYPLSEEYYEREISLPIYPKMTDKEVKTVIEVTKDVIEEYC